MSKKVKKPCDWCGDTWLSTITKDNLTFCDKFCQEEYESRLHQKVNIDLSNVDWAMLRTQKEALLLSIGFGAGIGEYTPDNKLESAVNGLIHLIDHIQDQAAEILGDERVFGKMTEEQIEKANEENMIIIGLINRINQEESKGTKSPVTRKRKR